MKLRLFLFLFITALLLVLGTIAAACGDGEEADITFEVTFDGDRCQYKGPEVIDEGEVVIVLNNLTDSSNVHFHVGKLLDEGKTLQDLDEFTGDAISGGPPPWLTEIARSELVEGSPRTEKYLFEPGIYEITCAEHVTFPIRNAAPFIEVRPNSSE